MNVFNLVIGLTVMVAGLVSLGINVWFLSIRLLKPSALSFIALFMAGITLVSGFLATAQVIEDYRGNPENNQNITGEDTINE